MSEEALEARKLIAAIRNECDRLAVTLMAVQEDQWYAPPKEPTAADDVRVSTSGHSDPTADTAVDPVRLSLREQVQTVERVLRHTLRQVQGVRVGLQNRHSGWERGRVQRGKDLPEAGVLA